MFPVLSEDVLDVILIDQAVGLQNRQRRLMLFSEAYDFLLVFQWYLGIWHKDIREEGMGGPAFPA